MLKEIIKHFRTQAQSRFNPSPDGSREKYYEGRKDAYNDCADVLERYAVKYPNGWRPASELPVIPEGEFSVSVIAYCHTPSGIYAPVETAYTRTGGWQYSSVKWWCYPPKE